MRTLSLAVAFFALFSTPVSAEYLPSQTFTEQMLQLLQLSKPEPFGDQGLVSRQVQVGTKYIPGEVAYYYGVFAGDYALFHGIELERWELVDGNFTLTAWRIASTGVTRSVRVLSSEGIMVNYPIYQTMAPEDPEAIKMSERAQEMLKRAGVPL